MRTYVKAIRYKWASDKTTNGKEILPCVACDKKCQQSNCEKLKNWLRGMDESSIEWESRHDGLVIARMVCRTVVWLAFVALLWYVASKFGNK